MADLIEATLTGSDGQVDGTAKSIFVEGYGDGYEFTSLDGSLQLTIAKTIEGTWERVTGTEPYFSGWVEELVEQVAFLNNA